LGGRNTPDERGKERDTHQGKGRETDVRRKNRMASGREYRQGGRVASKDICRPLCSCSALTAGNPEGKDSGVTEGHEKNGMTFVLSPLNLRREEAPERKRKPLQGGSTRLTDYATKITIAREVLGGRGTPKKKKGLLEHPVPAKGQQDAGDELNFKTCHGRRRQCLGEGRIILPSHGIVFLSGVGPGRVNWGKEIEAGKMSPKDRHPVEDRSEGVSCLPGRRNMG